MSVNHWGNAALSTSDSGIVYVKREDRIVLVGVDANSSTAEKSVGDWLNGYVIDAIRSSPMSGAVEFVCHEVGTVTSM